MVGVITIYLVFLRVFLVSAVNGGFICPEGVRSFSHEAEGRSYYFCEEDKGPPVLKTCKPGYYYWAYKKACHIMENSLSSEKTDHRTEQVYTRPALGDPAFLGDLYNSNTDEVLTGYSLWSSKTILKNKRKKTSPSVSIDVFATTSTIDRLQRTSFSPATKLGILGNLIQVKKSSAYLKDTLESENEIAIVLSYQATSQIDTLPVQTEKDFDLCGINGPTNVITSTTYGMGANFIFRKTLEDNENMNEAIKNLKFAVNAIKTTKADISGSIKKIVQNVSVDFFSDFVSEKEPGNYEESLKMYQTLSSRVGKFPMNANNTVTMEIELTPITSFCKGKRMIHISIADDILNSVSKMFRDMEKTKLIIKTLKMKQVVHSYLPLMKILQTLLEELTAFELHMRTDLRILLPRIRRGNSSEEELVLLLNKYTASPFYYDNVEAFLDNRRREINMLDFILNPTKLEGTDIKVLNYKQAIDIRTMFLKPFVLMLKYNILPSKSIIRKFLKGEKVDESKSWYNNAYVISTMGVQFNNFIKFSASNKDSKSRGYLLALADAKDDVININAQKEGLLYTFTFPEVPPILTSISNTHNSITFTVKHPSTTTWITGFLVSFRQYGSQIEQSSKPYGFSKNNLTTFKIDELMVSTVYQFSLHYLTPMGVSPPSPVSYLSTRPCSIPTNLRTSIVAADYFTINWDPPSTCGKDVHVRRYRVTVTGYNDFLRTIVVNGTTNADVKRLQGASTYNVSIQAVADAQKLNNTGSDVIRSLPAMLSVITRPDAPSYLSLVNRSIHSVVVTWTPTTKMATGAVLLKYQLKYGITNDLGDVQQKGTEMVVSTLNTSYHINNLIQGTTYYVSVRVITSKGDSDYSPSLIIKTMFQKSELDLIRESLNKSVATIESELTKQKEEIDVKISTNDARIKAINSNSLFMVYYPRLRSKGNVVDYASSCGGTINKGGGYLSFPTFWWTAYKYRDGEDCTWNINTGMPTTLTLNYCSFASGDYIRIYDEESYIGQYTSGGTFKTRSGKVQVMFHSDAGNTVSYGFRLHIAETKVKRIASQRYYSEYKTTFKGYGSPSSYTEHYTLTTLPKTNFSIPACIKDCNERYMRDHAWNEISIELDSDPLRCSCYKNAKGFTYSLSQFHYRIE